MFGGDMQDKCCLQGCNNPIAVRKHQLCRPHYARYVNHGPMDINSVPLQVKTKHKPFDEVMKVQASKCR